MYEEGKNNNNNNSISEISSSKVATRLDIFSSLLEEKIVKILKNIFKPINLYELSVLHSFEDTWEENSILLIIVFLDLGNQRVFTKTLIKVL